MYISPENFKSVMRRLLTGVTVISTRDKDGKIYGLTANSLTPLSLTPPLVLFCLNYNSNSLTPIRESKKFAVSILSQDQESIARIFAQSGIDKFAQSEYIIGSLSSCPLISDAICWIECEVQNEYPGGDHAIIVGLVESLQVNNASPPLVHYVSRYHNLSSI